MPNQLDLPKLDTKVKLTINQRNLWFYFLNHRKKYKNTPCYVPKVPMPENRRPDYLRALERLEEYGLIHVDRTSRHYTGWIMLDPA